MKMADGTEKEVFYNGFTRDEINSPGGLRNLGVEKARPIITRGILLDIAGYKEVPVLSSRYEVTVADVRGALTRQGMREESIEPGDAILLNYGWARNWKPVVTMTRASASVRTTDHRASEWRSLDCREEASRRRRLVLRRVDPNPIQAGPPGSSELIIVTVFYARES
jgi:hypothetical protein